MSTAEQILEKRIQEIIEPLGYALVFMETLKGRGRTLRVFIEHLDESKGAISVDDCAVVSRALDEPLDQLNEVNEVFAGTYQLEVSSPGVDRPLKRLQDFNRFKGNEVRVNTFRPLTGEELHNLPYQSKNPKQKTFLGKLLGTAADEKVILDMRGSYKADVTQIEIPLSLISKANIEPKFDQVLKEK